MSEEETDPKDGSDKEPSGDGQPEKVEISRSELEKLQKKSKDFDGIVEADKINKRNGRTIPGAEPIKEKEKEDIDDELTEEFITKKELDATLQKQVDDIAIAELNKDPFINEHYEEILPFVIFREGERKTVDGIKAAFSRGAKVLRSELPADKPKKDDTDKKVKSELAKDSGLGKGKDKESKPERKSIIPKQEKMEDWYGDKK